MRPDRLDYPVSSDREVAVMRQIPRWRENAACKDADMNLFFDSEDANLRKTALAFCAKCSVQPQCLYTALVLRENHGLWGGFSPRRRRTIFRRIIRIAQSKGIDTSDYNQRFDNHMFTMCQYQNALDI